jgi:hypothetical protein
MVRRATAAVSTVLLLLVSVAVAEAALLILLLVFSSILQLRLNFQVGEHFLQLWSNVPLGPYTVAMPNVTVLQGGIVASAILTLACGAGAAVLRYRQCRPAA